MSHQIVDVFTLQQADSGLTRVSCLPRESAMLAPLSQIMWGADQPLVADPGTSKQPPLDLGTLGAGIVSDDPRLLTLACALSH
jgi:hypothetical protein